MWCLRLVPWRHPSPWSPEEARLYYPPDPGAAEQSHIGGNLACNAGGPHSFKYGVTRDWVTGVEVVAAGGDLLRFGGAVRKDVAGYDLASLLVGSEGTLGVITGAYLKLIPAPEVAQLKRRAKGVRILEGQGMTLIVSLARDAQLLALSLNQTSLPPKRCGNCRPSRSQRRMTHSRRRRLEALGQYRANISGQLRRHVALPGRSLEFGRRFFRSF